MKNSTIEERFRWLKSMQEFTLLLHPPKDYSKKITIRKWILPGDPKIYDIE